jgi:hypothetical protein
MLQAVFVHFSGNGEDSSFWELEARDKQGW